MLRGQWSDVDIVTWDDDPGQFEYCCLFHTLPTLFGVEQPADVAAAPYLHATEEFRPLAGDFRVGLCWAGSPDHGNDLHRSTQLAAWQPVLDVPGVTFYSLQVGRGSEQVHQYESRVRSLSPELTDWEKTAAAMMQLDLIITGDTAVAHLAGAIGAPTWICLPTPSEYRWMLSGTTTHWYSTARLFRQPTRGDWGSVFTEVAQSLQELVHQNAGRAA